MRFWVYFLGCFWGSTKTRCLQGGPSSAFALAKTAADSQKGLGGARVSPPRNLKATANQNGSIRARHPLRRDAMEENQETFRLSPGFPQFKIFPKRVRPVASSSAGKKEPRSSSNQPNRRLPITQLDYLEHQLIHFHALVKIFEIRGVCGHFPTVVLTGELRG